MVCWYLVRDLATTRLDEIYCAGSGPLKVLDPATTGLNGRLCAGSRHRGTTRDFCVRHLNTMVLYKICLYLYTRLQSHFPALGIFLFYTYCIPNQVNLGESTILRIPLRLHFCLRKNRKQQKRKGKRQKSVYRLVTAPQGGTQKYTLAFAYDSPR